MQTFHTIRELRKWRHTISDPVGCVPTMGALHSGHLSLIAHSRRFASCTVATVFVNPTQFAPGEDFDRYPRTLDSDLRALESAGVEAVFAPETGELYPQGFSTTIGPPQVAQVLEGAKRPGHFAGVCQVVLKLLNIVQPDVACFGRKDYQQYLVIREMVADLNVPTRIEACETIREPDGLAMSSRNRYLDNPARARASEIPRALMRCRDNWRSGLRDLPELEKALRDGLEPAVDQIDYAVVRRAEDLQMPTGSGESLVALVAVRIGATRLIDNLMLD